MNAVVLAGGPPDAVAALAPGAPNKAFVPIAGKTLVQRTLAALRSTPAVGRIVVVAPPTAHARSDLAAADDVRLDGATMLASLRSGLEGLPDDERVLVCASDLPVLSRRALDEFLLLAALREADLVYGCVERMTHERQFGDTPHTWARLRDGTFCGAGVVMLRPRIVPALDGLLGRLGAARKNPLRLAAIFGTRALLRYAAGRLSLAEVELRATQLLGASAAAAVCTHAEIAINVDRPSDVALAERLVLITSSD
ncbi:MAG: nucleotidyltransferase family protein [Candidatus Eremiobacteraeota bacterium]|nr:nucleotidyltransferase family protein [Candidatus Eremiobacteraeota bacterium]